MNTQELMTKRAEITNEMHKVLDTAESADRDLNNDEQSQYDAMEKDVETIGNRIKNIEKQNKLNENLEKIVTNSVKPVVATSNKKQGVNGDAFFNYMRLGNKASPDVMNALQVGTNTEGGYIVPEEFEANLITALQDINEVRQYCNVIQTASTRHIPVETTLGTASWTAEEGATTESSPAFGRVSLNAYKLDTIVKVSEELLQDSIFDLANYLATNIGKRFGIAEEAAFVNGDGSDKPTGIIGGSSEGKVAASATAITSDELIDLTHSLDRPYRRNAVWMMNDSTAKIIRKLKDGDGQYLWQPGLQAGQPDVLFGRPVITSAAMPAATTGSKSIIFGDMSNYTVADRLGATLQRLSEIYLPTGQIGFRAYKRTDGKVTLSDGIKHLKQA